MTPKGILSDYVAPTTPAALRMKKTAKQSTIGYDQTKLARLFTRNVGPIPLGPKIKAFKK